MPNHVTNLVTFGSDSASLAVFQKMLQEMRVDGEPLGSFDFNKLIPMPPSLNIEESSRTERGLKLHQKFAQERTNTISRGLPPAEQAEALAELEKIWQPIKEQDQTAWELGEQAYSNLQKYGHATWYKWCVQNWGTKWNAYGSRPIHDGDDTMSFLTAWDPVPEIMQKLSKKYPKQAITYRWADEDIGRNVGEVTFKGGEVIEEHIPVPGSREAYEMSADIMEIELADLNLYLSKDGTTYGYREEPPVETAPPAKKKSRQKGQDR